MYEQQCLRLYQLSGQGTFEKLFELSVGLKRLYRSENIFDKDIMKNLSFAVEKVDRVADSLIPEHYRQANVKPIITRGDGTNCLFNATSLALCGSEKLSAELRVRTTIELVENLEFYKNHPILTLLANEFKTKNGSPWSVASLFDAIVFSNDSCAVCVKSGFDAALKCEARRTACLGTFSGLLQIMGLASAIGCEIHLIYPDPRHNMLSLINGIYQPRPGMIVSTDCPLESILIMWTDISGWPDRSKELSVNHFVPVLPINTQNCETIFWNVVGKKRNVKQSMIDSSRKAKSRKTCGYEKNLDYSASVKTAKRKVVQRKWVPSQASPKKNYCTCVKKSKKKSAVEQHVQPQAARPKNKWHFEQETKIHFSMPLLTRNWFEKRTSEERNRAELLRSSDCDSDPIILSMPLLSPTFYFQSADASDSDQVISMPLLSQRFYSKSTADCKKSTTHPIRTPRVYRL